MAGSGPDFLRFLEALRQGGAPILKRETVHAMMSNQIGSLRVNLEPTPMCGFGYGGAALLDPVLADLPQGVGTWKWGGVYAGGLQRRLIAAVYLVSPCSARRRAVNPRHPLRNKLTASSVQASSSEGVIGTPKPMMRRCGCATTRCRN
jgi:hypothetical protein